MICPQSEKNVHLLNLSMHNVAAFSQEITDGVIAQVPVFTYLIIFA